jgi:hypothetical protein
MREPAKDSTKPNITNAIGVASVKRYAGGVLWPDLTAPEVVGGLGSLARERTSGMRDDLFGLDFTDVQDGKDY